MSQAVDGLATAAFWIMAAGFILLLVGLALGPLFWDRR